jgi:hypothetical protein
MAKSISMYVIMFLPSKQPLQVPLLLVLVLAISLILGWKESRLRCSCGTGWAIIRLINTPTPVYQLDLVRSNLADVPSNTPRRIPHPIAEPNADLGPAVIVSESLMKVPLAEAM